MNDHFQFTDSIFEKQFANCTFNPSLFSHEAHLRLAWIHITKYGITEALQNIQSQLLTFVMHVGAHEKYNKTLTIAATKAVYHFTLKSTATNFHGFITEFPRLQYNFKKLMETHYSINIFNSENAKQTYLVPDLLPFDC
ncbi:hypothetical protein [Kordia sp.]|uniref:hypothetical protein n=1 Tax=Kordia sp. TaxID=1965332 RepID=UPI003D27CDE0